MREQRTVRLRSDPAVRFAAGELRRCLTRATGLQHAVQSRKRWRSGVPAFWLGLFSDFTEAALTDAAEGPYDDAILIRTGEDGGIIAGSNPRSVLLAVYRYLTELGFRWVRPGKDGEFVPALSLPLQPVELCETPSYRHRGVCIEGAVSYEHVRDMIDWMPKVGFNAYFIQFREAYNFFQRWYEHVANPTMRGRRFGISRARDLTDRIRAEVKKRGLVLHMVGHGWTCEPFGIPGTGWYQHEGPIPAQAREHLAEVGGKRDLWGGVALNTNLCYGNADTRAVITNAIVEYAAANSDVDVIHFWLADGSNNQCECPRCRDHLPSDLYTRMLNELDAQLTAAGLATRIVFLVYVDLLWSPLRERIANPDRFILMFAPITRSYTVPFAATAGSASTLPPYCRNQLDFPRDPQMNLAFLSGWQEQFDGDSFDFDYHFMWDHHKDPGQFAMAKVLHQDVQRLQDVALNGLVSCQNQRVFFPSGLGMTVMGRTLWDRTVSFDQIADTYFEAAFGDGGPDVKQFMARVSDAFDPRLLRGELNETERARAPARLATVTTLVEQFRPRVEGATACVNPCHAASWAYLDAHLELCLQLSGALIELCRNRGDEAREMARSMFEWVRRREPELHPVFDVFEFQLTLGPLFGISHAEVQG